MAAEFIFRERQDADADVPATARATARGSLTPHRLTCPDPRACVARQSPVVP
jgi:hypothetical protein